MTARPSSTVKAVLGPTNTGKTHLAIERLVAHSSGAIGFPLRLLAREVYDRVVALKGAANVALITGEERIEPKGARWLLCTAEAMPSRPDLAFVALDEAQLAADPERGHIFTDRLLYTRGREETLLLGASTLGPMIKALVPEAEIVGRPRFSTLSHVGARKLSRIPPRSAIVAFSAEQVYAVAEMLRRFRGGAAVVMGALSPQTRNAQVALFQSGEVDYIVATDAIGMGLNLDIGHVAFAGLSKFDGRRQRRLTPPEMAQIAGRAGRHQRDGTFGTLAGSGGGANGQTPEFSAEEIFAIEEHRFAPLTKLFWREAEPRFDSLTLLIRDLERPPDDPVLAPAPPAIDLCVLKILAEEPEIAGNVRGPAQVRRLWEACSLPDFRQVGPEQHARFIARLWQDLSAGSGYLGADTVPRAIAELDRTGGDIDALQQRIAAIRSWAYIAQRPDWVLAREEMTARARAVEARLSDALHARLTERFVNRRTTVLMKKLGADTGLLPVRIEADDGVTVAGEPIGTLAGFRFSVDPAARAGDRKLLLAAAERHLAGLLGERALDLAAQAGDLALDDQGGIRWQGHRVATLERGRGTLEPVVRLDPALAALPVAPRGIAATAIERWLGETIRARLGPLVKLRDLSRDAAAGPTLRALVLRLAEAGGILARDAAAEALDPAQRASLRATGVRVGALDLFVPALLRTESLALWARLAAVGRPTAVAGGGVSATMAPALPAPPAMLGYRSAGAQQVRVDLADKLISEAHRRRIAAPARRFTLDPARAVSMGLTTATYARLLRQAGFVATAAAAPRGGGSGPPAPPLWSWRPPRRGPAESPERTAPAGAFAALASWSAA